VIDRKDRCPKISSKAQGHLYARLRAKVVADAGRCGAARSKTVAVGR